MNRSRSRKESPAPRAAEAGKKSSIFSVYNRNQSATPQPSAPQSPPLPASPSRPVPPYVLLAESLPSEDILLCVDVWGDNDDPSAGGIRLAAVRGALQLFVHAKLTISTDHRFAFAAFGRSFSWIQHEFSNDIRLAVDAISSYAAAKPQDNVADITELLLTAAHAARISREQGRLLRVVFIYCRSSVIPQHEWPVSEKLFTLDVVYLHDKPHSITNGINHPQIVYDALVQLSELVSKHNAYAVEAIHGRPRPLHNLMCTLLSHPVQRCAQDDIDFPKVINKKGSGADQKKGSTSIDSYEDYPGLRSLNQ